MGSAAAGQRLLGVSRTLHLLLRFSQDSLCQSVADYSAQKHLFVSLGNESDSDWKHECRQVDERRSRRTKTVKRSMAISELL